MSQRAIDLSKRIEAFRDDVIAYVASLNDDEWNARCDWEEWAAGVTARHIGAGHFRIFELLGMILEGKDLPPLSMDQINAMSDKDSREHSDCTKAEALEELAAQLGPRAKAGMPREAAAFGDVVLVSVPYHAVPQIGRDFAKELAGKVVLETGNPYPSRDGEMAVAARVRGTGTTSAEFLPGVRLVRAFNTIPYYDLRSEAHRSGERVAIPLAGDDQQALEVASRLVKDAGFEPVVVGPLSRAKDFDFGTAVYARALNARELRQQLGID